MASLHPLNFRGEWKGNVLAQARLANSKTSSVKVLENVGFDAAIQRRRILALQTQKRYKHFPRF